jgi:alpha-D-xyloside xylohydrolase
MMRAMFLEYPDDPNCLYLDRQYMLGNGLLVAPIFSSKGDVSYYLPAGNWKNLFTGELSNGGVWRKERHDYFSLGLWINLDSPYETLLRI